MSVIDPTPLYNHFIHPEPAAPRHDFPKPSIKPPLSQLALPDSGPSTRPPSPPPMYGMLPSIPSHVNAGYDEQHPSPSFSTRPPSPFHERPPGNPFNTSHRTDFSIEIPSPGNPERAPPPDAIPNPDEGQDLAFDDESLSALEKIYLLARSGAAFHRIYISHALIEFLQEVAPREAVDFVLPLLSNLATDQEESVKEALACELVPIMWWFISNCRVVEAEPDYETDEPLIPVAAFTPILGTLLLSPNRLVGAPARAAVVDILARLRTAHDSADNGLLGNVERQLFERELLHQVVIGMSRLDQEGEQSLSEDEDDRPEVWWTAPSTPANPELFAGNKGTDASVNPYFPALSDVPEESASPSPPSSAADSPQSTPSSGTPTPLASARSNPLDKVSAALSQAAGTSSPSSISSGSSASSQSSQSLTPDLSPASGMSAPSPTSPPEPVSPIQNAALTSPQVREHDVVGPSTESSDSWLSGISPDDMPEIHMPDKFAGGKDQQAGQMGVALEEDDADTPSDLTDLETDAGEQAAVGKVSSMSLMAALSATCSLDEDIQAAFVKEVGRVGRDPIYWVRREASFALGALAKVVPLEIVITSLLPLFESLCVDSEWHVRHSAIFALPGLLSRLPPTQRRLLALKTIPPLARDPEGPVRSGLLEALGEVIYTFHNDKDGPPDELLDLFLGRKANDSRQKRRNTTPSAKTTPRSPWVTDPGDFILLGDDPARLLICAFNFPAVALTLGRARWGELRESYVALAKDPTPRVRKTLAASVGEIAKIIGPEHSKRDLVPLWLECIKGSDSEVRLKAAESLETFVGALGRPERVVVVQTLQQAWSSGALRGWRERDVAAHTLQALLGLIADTPGLLRSLLKLGLQDDVAAVRAAAVSSVPAYFRVFSQRRDILESLSEDIRQLASSSTFRKRNTYISCQEALVLSDAGPTLVTDTELWRTLATLAKDNVVDVRIGVSRLVRLIVEKFFQTSRPLPKEVSDVITHLKVDQSREVRAFAPEMSQSRLSLAEARPPSSETTATIFSRPPPSGWDAGHSL